MKWSKLMTNDKMETNDIIEWNGERGKVSLVYRDHNPPYYVITFDNNVQFNILMSSNKHWAFGLEGFGNPVKLIAKAKKVKKVSVYRWEMIKESSNGVSVMQTTDLHSESYAKEVLPDYTIVPNSARTIDVVID